MTIRAKILRPEPLVDFHEPRMYITPATYQGEKILAYVASCRSCVHQIKHISRQGRDRMVWRHRRQLILNYRTEFLAQHHGANSAKIAEGLRFMADRDTHSYPEWVEAVQFIMTEYIGGASASLEEVMNGVDEGKYRVYYEMGWEAVQGAQDFLDLVFDFKS